MASRFKQFKLLTALSRLISSMLNPMLAPTYGTILVLWTSVLCSESTGTRTTIVIVMMGLTCILPVTCIGLMHHYGFISDKRLRNPKERTIPYIFAIVCYVIATFYINSIHAPAWFTMFAAGGTLTLLITTLVNFKWKISAHMGGMGGIVALLYQMHVEGISAFDLFWVLCAAIMLSGLLGSARMLLKCHTAPQVILGFANGYACVTLAMKLLG
ncbi:MAG: hypothetical protein MJZ74_04795 [Muribaculaceae bacterium]|nr:hypothetical protein [Muribaculaceae bacterium]